MIINIPIIYSASILRPRKRTPEEVAVRDVWAVEIREPTPEEAPLVLRMPSQEQRAKKSKDFMVDVRAFDGKLWVQSVFHTSTGDEDRMMTPETYQQAIDDRAWMSNQTKIWDSDHTFMLPIVDTLAGPDIREVRFTRREDRIQRLESQAREMILIDGYIYTPTAEPKLLVDWTDSSNRHLWVEVTLETPGNKGDCDQYFRADRMEDALRFAEEELGNPIPEENRSKIVSKCGLEVYDASYLKFDGESITFRHSAEKFLNMISRDLKKAPRDFLIAYADLRDAMDEIKGQANLNLHLIVDPLQRAIDQSTVYANIQIDKESAREGNYPSIGSEKAMWIRSFQNNLYEVGKARKALNRWLRNAPEVNPDEDALADFSVRM